MKAAEDNTYRSIFKATTLFGGVQIYQILIGIVKSKLIALILGPTGMGIQGLFLSAIDLVKQFTSFGLAQSAVKDISVAADLGDFEKVSRTIIVLRKIVWITGLLGCIFTIVFSNLLSKYTFGNSDYTLPFALLSLILLFDQICAGQKVLLQGLRKLKDLARCSVLGSTFGLVISIPLYYLLGVRGIAPSLILSSISALCLSWYFSRKIPVKIVNISLSQVFQESCGMVKMGIALSFSSILVSICSFVLRSYIREIDGTEAVGLFSAGFIIVNTYVGMVFNAMGTDYYPRLAVVSSNKEACSNIVNRQCEIGILILTPLLSCCLVFTPIVILLLYSKEFSLCNDYVQYAAVGMFFKLISWCISYQFIAKGESKIFIINELVQNTYSLIINIIGYKLLGLSGLGIAFIIANLIYLIQVFAVAKHKYAFSFNKQFQKLCFGQLFAFLCLFIMVLLFDNSSQYLFCTPIVLVITSYSFFQLQKRLQA